MSMKIAHFSDLHYADETLAEVDRCFTHAVGQAIASPIEVAIITGDTTDHALNAHSPAVVALARQVQRLANHCPVLMLQGTYSHEPPGFLALFRLIRSKYPICVAEHLQQVALTHNGRWVVSDGWQFDAPPADMTLLCTCIPTMNRAALAAVLPAVDAAGAMGDQLACVVSGYAPSHLTARQAGIPVIALSHGTVHNCITEHGVPMAGADHEFTTGVLFSASATAVMLGHIHKHQSWSHDGLRIAYAGSIGRLHYGEEGDKGFLLWDIAADHASFSLVPTPARRTLDICFDGPPDMDRLEQIVQEQPIDDTWVRVRWQVLEEDRALVDRARIEALLSSAAGVKLEGRIVPLARTRAAGIAREHSLVGQIEQWAALVGVSPRDALSCLDCLRHASPEDIARGILSPQAEDSAQLTSTDPGCLCTER